MALQLAVMVVCILVGHRKDAFVRACSRKVLVKSRLQVRPAYTVDCLCCLEIGERDFIRANADDIAVLLVQRMDVEGSVAT